VPDPAFVEAYAKFWYILVSAGVILLAFTVTIRKPIEDSVE
jgi:hypothetical protein